MFFLSKLIWFGGGFYCGWIKIEGRKVFSKAAPDRADLEQHAPAFYRGALRGRHRIPEFGLKKRGMHGLH